MFTKFSKAVHERFVEMSKGELFVVDVGNTADSELFDKYLSFYPEGTNPVYRQRTVHDCQCCKQFIRRLGNVVTIKDGQIVSVWDNLDIPSPYKEVADKLSDLVRKSPIKTVFRTTEPKFGTDHNYDPKTEERYDHFHGEVAPKHYSKKDADTMRGEREAIFQVCNRGLNEIREEDLDTVLDLINSNGLYRGEEHKPALLGFQQLKKEFKKAPNGEIFVWANLENRNSRFRNTVIGTLLTDLAEGKDLEVAVKSFESKVAPANYKRPAPVITQRMTEAAIQTLTDLGLGGAIYRRYARLEDVSVNDVLFVDNAFQSRMKGGVNDIVQLLESSITKARPDLKAANPVTVEHFLKEVLPKAKSMELFLENRHAGNFVSLTGGDGPERLFKWDNNFAWSYAGDLTDSMKRRVVELGGRVDGPFRFTHSWNHEEWGRNESLMDLHVFFPGHRTPKDGKHDNYGEGRRIGWNHRKDFDTGGLQDVDHTHAAKPGEIPIENISFPTLDKMPEGTYTLKIHNWALRGITKSGFKAEVEAGGQMVQFEYPKPLAHKEWVTVATVDLKNGQFTINPVLPTVKSSRDIWGVKTETLVPVVAVMNSPNHWGDQKVGAKHLIFSLKDCKNPEPTRGIYNEFLRADLDKHRKVFEVLGAKTKCKPTDDQVSGVGFTAARGDSVTIVVDGRRSYTVSF